MANTKFNQLTQEEQQVRLAKYAKERAERGTVQELARLVAKPTVRENKNGSHNAYIRLAVYNKETGDTRFFSASAHIAKDKDSLLNFYQTALNKGDLVSVEHKTEVKGDRTYINIFRLMKRQVPKKQAPVAQAEPDVAVESNENVGTSVPDTFEAFNQIVGTNAVSDLIEDDSPFA